MSDIWVSVGTSSVSWESFSETLYWVSDQRRRFHRPPADARPSSHGTSARGDGGAGPEGADVSVVLRSKRFVEVKILRIAKRERLYIPF